MVPEVETASLDGSFAVLVSSEMDCLLFTGVYHLHLHFHDCFDSLL